MPPHEFQIRGRITTAGGSWKPGVMSATVAKDKTGRERLTTVKVELDPQHNFSHRFMKLPWTRGKHKYYLLLTLYESLPADSDQVEPRSVRSTPVQFEVTSK